MFEESAAEFAAYLVANPVETKYGLLAEYLYGGRGIPGGIHCYIIDSENRLAFEVLQNSHWSEFQEVNPQTVEDCTEVLIRVLRNELTEGGEE